MADVERNLTPGTSRGTKPVCAPLAGNSLRCSMILLQRDFTTILLHKGRIVAQLELSPAGGKRPSCCEYA